MLFLYVLCFIEKALVTSKALLNRRKFILLFDKM